ncbi:MAG: hypothetical protein ACI909_000881, partial [Planctomycetota bacterium]
MFKEVKERLKQRRDSEHEQALIRLLSCILLTFYTAIAWHYYDAIDQIVFYMYAVSLIICIAIIAWIHIDLSINHVRRLTAMFADVGTTTFALT